MLKTQKNDYTVPVDNGDTMPVAKWPMARNYHRWWAASYISQGHTVHDVVQPCGGQLDQGFNQGKQPDITDSAQQWCTPLHKVGRV